MNATVTCDIPPQVVARLAEFCGAVKTGTMQLDIKDGRVIGWKLTENGRVERK